MKTKKQIARTMTLREYTPKKHFREEEINSLPKLISMHSKANYSLYTKMYEDLSAVKRLRLRNNYSDNL